jgi:hypothetical protein
LDSDPDPAFHFDADADPDRIQIRIPLSTLMMIRILFHFDADPKSDPTFHFDADPKSDPTFHFDADPDPAPHLSDANLLSLVSRPSTAPFSTSTPPFSASTTLYGYILSLQASSVPSAGHGFILSFLRSWILISMRIRIQLLSVLWIRIREIFYNKHSNLTLIRAMLDKLDGRVPAQDGQLLLPPVQDSNGSQVTLNLGIF